MFLNDLERTLTHQLGVEWGPDRNGCREMVGFTREQLRTFSKRTVAIETHLEAAGELAFDSKRDRMRADDQASLATRQHKDTTLTPERLRDRWTDEAATVGLEPGDRVDDLVVGRRLYTATLTDERDVRGVGRSGDRVVCHRLSFQRGPCRRAGRRDLRRAARPANEIKAVTHRFLASRARRATGSRRGRAPTAASGRPSSSARSRIGSSPTSTSCRNWSGCRVIPGARRRRRSPTSRCRSAPIRPSGRGCAGRAGGAGRDRSGRVRQDHRPARRRRRRRPPGGPVVVVAPTHKAVAELRAAGLDAQTIARFACSSTDQPIAADTTVVVDEMSQVATRDAAADHRRRRRRPGRAAVVCR